MIVDPDGRILSQASAGPGEAIVVGPISIETVREERRRRVGHSMPVHLRPEAYPRQREARLAPGPQPEERTIAGLEERIRESGSRLGWATGGNS